MNGLVNGIRLLATAILSELETTSYAFISISDCLNSADDVELHDHMEVMLPRYTHIQDDLNHQEYVIIEIDNGDVRCFELYAEAHIFHIYLTDLNINQLCQVYEAIEVKLKII